MPERLVRPEVALDEPCREQARGLHHVLEVESRGVDLDLDLVLARARASAAAPSHRVEVAGLADLQLDRGLSVAPCRLHRTRIASGT